MRVIALSDTHGQHRRLDTLPEADLLIHAGDVMTSGWDPLELADFNVWLSQQPVKHTILVPGNHDWLFEKKTEQARALVPNAIVLMDQLAEVEGLKIWGSPWQPEFMNWAFNLPRGASIKRKWDLIPPDIDILITHGPPKFHGDKAHRSGEHLGCKDLLCAVERIMPLVHIFGHIHGGTGRDTVPTLRTHFINASVLNEAYKLRFTPHVFDLVDGKVTYA